MIKQRVKHLKRSNTDVEKELLQMQDGSQLAGGVLLKNGSEGVVEHHDLKVVHGVV